MAKMGRPFSEDPKQYRITFRMNAEDYQKLKEYASEHNLTLTEVMQRSLGLLYKEQ